MCGVVTARKRDLNPYIIHELYGRAITNHIVTPAQQRYELRSFAIFQEKYRAFEAKRLLNRFSNCFICYVLSYRFPKITIDRDLVFRIQARYRDKFTIINLVFALAAY